MPRTGEGNLTPHDKNPSGNLGKVYQNLFLLLLYDEAYIQKWTIKMMLSQREGMRESMSSGDVCNQFRENQRNNYVN